MGQPDLYPFVLSPSVVDKLRFARLMLRAFGKRDWSEWSERSAADLVDAWAGPEVRRAIFEPLTRIRFTSVTDADAETIASLVEPDAQR